MKKEDKISLAFLAVFVLGLLNLIINLAVRIFSIRLTITQSRILFLVVFSFALAIIFSSKEKILKNGFYNYFKKQILLFLQTFKEWKLLIKGIAIDFLALFSIILIIFLAVRFIKWNFSFMEQIPGFLTATQSYLQTGAKVVDSALQQELQKNAPSIKNALIFSGMGIIAAYILAIFSFGFFQGMLYSNVNKCQKQPRTKVRGVFLSTRKSPSYSGLKSRDCEWRFSLIQLKRFIKNGLLLFLKWRL